MLVKLIKQDEKETILEWRANGERLVIQGAVAYDSLDDLWDSKFDAYCRGSKTVRFLRRGKC